MKTATRKGSLRKEKVSGHITKRSSVQSAKKKCMTSTGIWKNMPRMITLQVLKKRRGGDVHHATSVNRIKKGPKVQVVHLRGLSSGHSLDKVHELDRGSC